MSSKEGLGFGCSTDRDDTHNQNTNVIIQVSIMLWHPRSGHVREILVNRTNF